MILVEFCSSNMLKGSQEVFEKLNEDPSIDCIDYGCLSQCGLCSNVFYVFVEGEIVSAKSPEKLLEKVYKRIAKIKKQWEFEI